MLAFARFAPPTPARLTRYLQERFPLTAHGPLVIVFAAAAVGVGGGGGRAIALASVSLLMAFLVLRIADEHKDFWTDARYRRHRPVPRGLVTLAELRAVAGGAIVVQGGVAVLAGGLPLLSLLLVWGYTALMSVEFGCPQWLRARPGLYLATHLGILPVLVLHAATFGAAPDAGALGCVMAVAYAAGIVLEVGRKVAAPSDERLGVETYTAAWGRRRAVALWLSGMGGAALCALPVVGAASLLLIPLLGLATGVGRAFALSPTTRRARHIARVSGAWLLGLFALVATSHLF